MKLTIQAESIGSTYTYLPGGKAQAVYKTLDNGQYSVKAKNMVMENAKTGERISIGDTTPVSSKELFEYNMVMPRARLDETLPGKIGTFFRERGTFSDKDQWIVKYEG